MFAAPLFKILNDGVPPARDAGAGCHPPASARAGLPAGAAVPVRRPGLLRGAPWG